MNLTFINHQNIISWHTNDILVVGLFETIRRRSLRNLWSCLKRRKNKLNSNAGLVMPQKRRWGMISNSASPFLWNQRTAELLIPLTPEFILDTTDWYLSFYLKITASDLSDFIFLVSYPGASPMDIRTRINAIKAYCEKQGGDFIKWLGWYHFLIHLDLHSLQVAYRLFAQWSAKSIDSLFAPGTIAMNPSKHIGWSRSLKRNGKKPLAALGKRQWTLQLILQLVMPCFKLLHLYPWKWRG